MTTPSCRDALSREIYEPVHDPITGICYRNACAAEEAGAFTWQPGCAPMPMPIYGNYDDGSASDGGGGSYEGGAGPGWRPWFPPGGGRRRRHRHPGPGASAGRTVGAPSRPARSMMQPVGTPGGGARLIGGPTQDTTNTLAIASPSGAQLIGGPGQAPGQLAIAARYTQPMYQALAARSPASLVTRAGSYAMPSSPRAQVVSRPSSQAMTASAPRAQFVGRTGTALRGLGQLPLPTVTPSAPRSPLQTIGDAVTHFAAPGWGRVVLMIGLAAITPPILVGGLTRWKTKSWRTAGIAAVGAAAIEGAAVGAYTEWHRNQAAAAGARLTSGSPL